MSATPKLGINLLATNIVSKEIVINEALVILDALVARSAKALTNTPPSTPADGDTYIVGTAPTGVWASNANQIAFYFNGWRFVVPPAKIKFWREDTSAWWTWSGSAWAADPVSAVATLDDLSDVALSSPANGNVLQFNGTQWVNQALALSIALSGLSDVVTTGLGDGKVLAWNAGTSKWTPVALPTGGVNDLGGLDDVDMDGASAGYVLTWNGSVASFQPIDFPDVPQLDDLTDVVVAGATAGQVLTYNGAAWGPANAPGAVTYQDEGTVLTGTVNAINFTGAGVVASIAGSVMTVTIAGGVAGMSTDTDGTLAANSDTRLPTQKAVKTYVDNKVTGLLNFKGDFAAGSNPNYPAAVKGDAYTISTAGKIGGASGTSVDIGDVVVAKADNAGGTQASVGTSWFVLEHNLVGALLTANALSELSGVAATARGNISAAGSGAITASGLTQSTAKLIGRTTAATGAPEEIGVDSSLTLASGTLKLTSYMMSFFFTSVPTAAETLAIHVAGAAFTIPANFAAALQSSVGTNPTATFAIDVQKNGSSIGTISISTSGAVTATTASGTSKAIAVGDVIKFVAPSSVDTTAANMAFTILGAR